MTITAGIDIGSSTIKLSMLVDGAPSQCEVVPSTHHPQDQARKILNSVPRDVLLVATGYGRDLIEAIRPVATISEIKAHALGARHLCPSCRSVIDIGGQDVKIISLDAAGKISKFELNDRCSAGTGKFFEIMAEKLGYTLSEFGNEAIIGKPGVAINAQCTVFAESEIIGLLNRGSTRKDISRAIHLSAINRIKAMFCRIDAIGPTAITGGCSKNLALVKFLKENLDVEILNHPYSQFAGSIGCAFLQCQAHELFSRQTQLKRFF